MNKRIVALILPGVVLSAWFWFSRSKTEATRTGTVSSGKSVAAQEAAVARALSTEEPRAAAVIASNFAAATPQTIFYSAPPGPPVAPAGKPAPLEYTNLAPELVLDNVRHAVRDYRSMFGGNPVGVNPEIAAQLNGNNPKQANFIQPDSGMRLNEQGELVDSWGTPYFFHQLSGIDMEIRSAGPDKIMWTADDLTMR